MRADYKIMVVIMSSSNASRLKSIIGDIADAIRYKRSTSSPIPMVDMAEEIMNIEFDTFMTFDKNISVASRTLANATPLSSLDTIPDIESTVTLVTS